MTTALDTRRRFEPGTLGWTADDLDDPVIERQWLKGRYEIVDGVLATMPAAYFPGGEVIANLIYLLKSHLRSNRLAGRISVEVDLVLRNDRVARADAVLLLPADERRQKAASRKAGKSPDLKRTRILVPPTLVIESVSEGHEHHDRETKRRWYAEAGIPHYWIVDALGRSFECLVLKGDTYRVEQSGRNKAKLRPAAFPGLVQPLEEIWG